jgi:hypothetical protein
MAIDLTNLNETADALISSLESDFQVDDAVVADVLILAEVRIGDERRQLRITPRHGMPSHARLGLLGEAVNLATAGQMRRLFEGAKRASDDDA